MNLKEFLLGNGVERRAVDPTKPDTTPLTKRQQTQREAEQEKQKKLVFGLRRRQLLTTIATTIGATAFIGTTRAIIGSTEKGNYDLVPLNEFIEPVTKSAVRQELDQLPDSPYKFFAHKYLRGLFDDEEPTSINIGGEDFKVWGVHTGIKTDQNFLGGKFNPRTATRIPVLHLSKPAEFSVVVPHFYGELPLRANIQFTSQQEIADGIEPGLYFLYNSGFRVPRHNIEIIKALRRASIIKEAFSAAYSIAVAEGIVTATKDQGLPISLTDQGRKIEMIWNSMAALSLRNEGRNRFIGMLDASPLVMALKATQNNPAIIAMNDLDPTKKAFRDTIKGRDFGTEDQLIPNIAKFLIANPNIIRGVGVVGDISITP